MWDVLAEGMDGYVVLVDLSRPDSFQEAAAIIRHFRNISDAPFVIGANKGSGDPAEIEGLAEAIGGGDAPVVVCDANDRDSAREMLLALLGGQHVFPKRAQDEGFAGRAVAGRGLHRIRSRGGNWGGGLPSAPSTAGRFGKGSPFHGRRAGGILRPAPA